MNDYEKIICYFKVYWEYLLESFKNNRYTAKKHHVPKYHASLLKRCDVSTFMASLSVLGTTQSKLRPSRNNFPHSIKFSIEFYRVLQNSIRLYQLIFVRERERSTSSLNIHNYNWNSTWKINAGLAEQIMLNKSFLETIQ